MNKQEKKDFFQENLETRPQYIYKDYYLCFKSSRNDKDALMGESSVEDMDEPGLNCKNFITFVFRFIYKLLRLLYTSILFYFLPMISLYMPFWISYLTGNQLTRHRIND